MDFIERWLGISPDGGNGMLELVILVSLAALGYGVWVLIRQRRSL